jgi:uncharacterized membrane protein YfcA
MEYVIVCLTAMTASGLTLFSGFGLGTIMTPVFFLFFPLELAIALTAIVHFLNNLFKLGLMGRHAVKEIIIKFGIPAIGAALLGAMLLDELVGMPAWHSYELGGKMHEITPVKLIIAVLMFGFALQDIIPSWSFKKKKAKFLILGGVLSGFFGGLSGHQGALRSMFLLNIGLSKEAFVATGIVIACFIDTTRLTKYMIDGTITDHVHEIDWILIAAATLAAFAGAYIGRHLLKKVTIRSLQLFVGILLIVFAIGMGTGLL